jgi:hypothetical protein
MFILTTTRERILINSSIEYDEARGDFSTSHVRDIGGRGVGIDISKHKKLKSSFLF